MRTIDPFLAPGLWGGLPKPPQSSMMAAGRFLSPPRRPAVIAHGALASLAGSALASRFYAWHGRAGHRYICSVFPVLESEDNKGLPDFPEAIVIAAGRNGARLRALAVFGPSDGVERSMCVDEAISAGAVEWHVHLPAGNDKDWSAVLRDLEDA